MFGSAGRRTIVERRWNVPDSIEDHILASGNLVDVPAEPLHGMGVAGGTPSPSRRPGSDAPTFFGDALSLVESKLSAPHLTDGIIPRNQLTERLRSHAGPLAALFAAPGYGKTTLLAQWVRQDSRPSAWVSLDDDDNDPSVLLAYVAAALDRIAPIDPGVFESLAAPGGVVHRSALPQVAMALARMPSPFTLVLDDVHALHQPSCLDAVHVLCENVPEGSEIVLSGRADPLLRVARLRIQGVVLDIGRQELQMEAEEASELLRAAGVELSENDVDDLVRRTEGWPAGLYMAALAVKARGVGARGPIAFTGEDWLVADYLRSEILSALPPDDVLFLTRSAVLKRMNGDLCDWVLGSTSSGHRLEALERSNLFLIPLDRRREWYRYHHLFRDLLLLELQHREPAHIRGLLGRAADWCEAHGQPEAAIGYAQAAGDVDRAAELIARCALPAYQRGRGATVLRWLEWLDAHGSIERYPPAAIPAAYLMAFLGRPAESERWADAAWRGSFEGPAPDGSRSLEPWLALLSAFQFRNGVDRMHDDAELAVRTLAPRSPWRATALLLLGISLLLGGSTEEADKALSDAAENAERLGAGNSAVIANAERALLALRANAWEEAQSLSDHALAQARTFRLEEHVLTTIAYAVAARIAQHRGDAPLARETLIKAGRLRPQITHALSFFAVQVLVELARAHVAMSDATGARTILREVDQLLRRRPDLRPLFEEQLADIKRPLEEMRAEAVGVSALTAAELRLLPFLPTHLTFREIGARLYVSPHTVKSQAISVYRKLGVTSRGGAIDRARSAGLL